MKKTTAQKKAIKEEAKIAAYNPLQDNQAWINAMNLDHVKNTFPGGLSINNSFSYMGNEKVPGYTLGSFVIIINDSKADVFLGPPEYKQQIGSYPDPYSTLLGIYEFAIFSPKNVAPRMNDIIEGSTCKISGIKNSKENKATLAWSIACSYIPSTTFYMEGTTGVYWIPEFYTRFRNTKGIPVNMLKITE